MTPCVHELDEVRLREGVRGYDPTTGEKMPVAAGTEGTVIGQEMGSPWLEIEVVADSGVTSCVFWARADQVVVTRAA